MKTKKLIAIISFYSVIICLSFASQKCYKTCSGSNSLDTCGGGSDCQTGGDCSLMYLSSGYTWGECSNNSNDWEDGCDSGFTSVSGITTYDGTCSASCGCQIPHGEQPFSDTGAGNICWQDCCTGA